MPFFHVLDIFDVSRSGSVWFSMTTVHVTFGRNGTETGCALPSASDWGQAVYAHSATSDVHLGLLVYLVLARFLHIKFTIFSLTVNDYYLWQDTLRLYH